MDALVIVAVIVAIILLAGVAYVAVPRRKPRRRPPTRYFSHTFAVRDQADLPSIKDQVA